MLECLKACVLVLLSSCSTQSHGLDLMVHITDFQVSCSLLSQAVDEFFSNIGTQKLDMKALQQVSCHLRPRQQDDKLMEEAVVREYNVMYLSSLIVLFILL